MKKSLFILLVLAAAQFANAETINIAGRAATSGTAQYATSSGSAALAGSAVTSGTAQYATTSGSAALSGSAITAGSAALSGTAQHALDATFSSNATSLIGAGNIVTHNVAEFATASQGTKADAAIPASGGTGAGLMLTGTTTNSGVITGGTIHATDALTSGSALLSGTATRSIYTGRIATAPGMLFWYDAHDLTSANGSVVTTWPDRSGNGWTLSGTGTYASGGLNGCPTVKFSPVAGQTMSSGTTMVSGTYTNLTIYWVEQVTSIANTSFNAPTIMLGNDGNKGAFMDGVCQATGGGTDLYAHIQKSSYSNSGRKIKLDNYRASVRCYAIASGTVSLWIDGVCVSAETATPFEMYGGVVLGAVWTTNVGVNFSAAVGYLAGHSPADIRAISAELEAKYHLHDQPRVYVTGDSILEGDQVASPATPFNLLQPRFPTLKLINIAQGGQYLSQIAANAMPYNEQLLSLRYGDVLLLSAGSIDIGGQTATATVEGYATTVINSAHAQGAKVWLVTMLPRYNNSNSGIQAATEAQRLVWNSWIASGTSGADGYIDLCRSPLVGQPGQNTNTTYYADAPNGVHPNAAGYLELANILEDGIRAATGLSGGVVQLTGTLTSGSCTITDARINNRKPWATNAQADATNLGALTVGVSGSTATIVSSNVLSSGTVNLCIPR